MMVERMTNLINEQKTHDERYKVKFKFMKKIEFEEELTKTEIDEMVDYGVPDWAVDHANEMDNYEVPLVFTGWECKEKE